MREISKRVLVSVVTPVRDTPVSPKLPSSGPAVGDAVGEADCDGVGDRDGDVDGDTELVTEGVTLGVGVTDRDSLGGGSHRCWTHVDPAMQSLVTKQMPVGVGVAPQQHPCACESTDMQSTRGSSTFIGGHSTTYHSWGTAGSGCPHSQCPTRHRCGCRPCTWRRDGARTSRCRSTPSSSRKIPEGAIRPSQAGARGRVSVWAVTSTKLGLPQRPWASAKTVSVVQHNQYLAP